MPNEITQSKPKFSVVIQSDAYKKLINNTLGDKDRATRFIASISSAVATNSQLQECEPSTIITGALVGEALGLSPSPQLGQYYLVGYKNSKTGKTEAVFTMGYKGYISMLIKSGLYKDLDAFEIREGEFKGREKETGKFKFEFIEDEDLRLSKPVIGYMAYFTMQNGFTKTVYMSKSEMLNHADKYSKAFNKADYEKLLAGQIPEKDKWKYSSFWYKDFDSQSLKTVLRRLISKWGILSTEVQNAYEKDTSIIKEDGSCEYVDNPQLNDDVEEAEITEIKNAPKSLNDIE